MNDTQVNDFGGTDMAVSNMDGGMGGGADWGNGGFDDFGGGW